MRLAHLRISEGGATPVVSADGQVWGDVSTFASRFTGACFEALPELHLRLPELSVVASTVNFGPPLTDIGKIVCIGLNYCDHAEETRAAIPGEPVVFLKTPDTVVGPGDEVLIPRRSAKTDYEG